MYQKPLIRVAPPQETQNKARNAEDTVNLPNCRIGGPLGHGKCWGTAGQMVKWWAIQNWWRFALSHTVPYKSCWAIKSNCLWTTKTDFTSQNVDHSYHKHVPITFTLQTFLLIIITKLDHHFNLLLFICFAQTWVTSNSKLTVIQWLYKWTL